MSSPCREHRAALMPYLRGEMRALEERFVEAHLTHCSPCTQLVEDLRQGFDETKSWQPELSAAHMQQLTARLKPYLQAAPVRESSRVAPWLLVFSASMALVLAVAGLWLVTPSEQPATQISFGTPSLRNTMPSSIGITRSESTLFLRLLASRNWDGRSHGSDEDLSVSMAAGFAIFAFEGGEGRRLHISAPSALVQVVGTRFFVEVAPGEDDGDDGDDGIVGNEITIVGVAEGTVRVQTLAGSFVLQAGDTRAFDAVGAPCAHPEPRAAAFLDDPFLMGDEAAVLDFHGRGWRRAARAGRRPSGEAVAPNVEKALKVVATLERAEQYKSAGAFDAAIDLYREIAKDRDPVAAPYRDLARHEQARILGLNLGEMRRAQAILRQLVRKGRGEARRQASLTLCELPLSSDPCAAAHCLHELLNAHNADFQVMRDAEQYLDVWRLRSLRCDSEPANNDGSAQQGRQ